METCHHLLIVLPDAPVVWCGRCQRYFDGITWGTWRIFEEVRYEPIDPNSELGRVMRRVREELNGKTR